MIAVKLRGGLRVLRHWLGPAVVVAAIALSALMLARGGTDLSKQPIRLNVPLFCLASVIVLAAQFPAALIWRGMLATFGTHVSLSDDIRLYTYSSLGLALPGSIWVLTSRTALYHRLGLSGLNVAAASILEAMVTGVAAIAVYAATILFYPHINFWRSPAVGFGFAALALGLIQPPIFNRLTGLCLRLARRPVESNLSTFTAGQLFVWFLIKGLLAVIAGGALFILLSSITPVPTDTLWQLTAAWAAAVATGNLFFVVPGTSLLRDGFLVLALAPVLPMPLAILFAVLSRLWSIAILLVSAGLVWLVLDLPKRLRKRSASTRRLEEGEERPPGPFNP